MCFYVYAPSGNISLEYVSEAITLLGKSSEIIVDALVKNAPEADAPIATLNVLYPNSFFFGRGSKLVYEGKFNDISEELHEKSWPNKRHNELYESMSFQPQWRQVNGGTEFRLTCPDPTDTSKDEEHVGLIGDPSVIEILSGLTDEQRQILHECRTTVFRCRLDREIRPGEKRWFRWRICPPYTALNRVTRFRRLLDWLLDQTEFRYRVSGPVNVRREFEKVLGAFIRTCKSRPDMGSSALKHAEALYNILAPGLSSAKVDIQKWRLHILLPPGGFASLESLLYAGDITVSGSLPNYLQPISKTGKMRPWLQAYQWKTGIQYMSQLAPSTRSVEQPDERGMFEISFVGRPINRVARALPWLLSLALVLVGYFLWRIGARP